MSAFIFNISALSSAVLKRAHRCRHWWRIAYKNIPHLCCGGLCSIPLNLSLNLSLSLKLRLRLSLPQIRGPIIHPVVPRVAVNQQRILPISGNPTLTHSNVQGAILQISATAPDGPLPRPSSAVLSYGQVAILISPE